MGHVTAEKDVEIQEGSALPDFPRAGAGPSHEVQQARPRTSAARRGGRLRSRPFVPRTSRATRLRIDVKRTDESSVGVGSGRAQLGGFHGGVNSSQVLKKRGQPRPVNEKEHQLEAHAFERMLRVFQASLSGLFQG